MSEGFYSVAYLQDGRENGSLIHWYVWAAWTAEPTGKPWTKPLATGRVRHSYSSHMVYDAQGEAEIAADDVLRAAGLTETKRIGDSFARAAYRESKGAAPNWRAPRPSKYKYATPTGFSRPPRVTAREFFEAERRRVEDGAQRLRERLRGNWTNWGWLTGAIASDDLRELGLSPGATEADVRRAYRKLAIQHHPDHGGDAAVFRRVTAARDRALAAVS